MGLFDMFGAGGGTIAIQPVSSAVAPGQSLVGNVIFRGGKRAQQINALTIRLTQELRQMEMTNQGPQPRSHTRDIVPSTSIAQPFMSTADQPTTIPFQLPLPQGLQNSAPNVVTYRLSVSADIPGEVDPGAGVEIQVVGGVDAAQPGMMQPGMMQPGMMQPGMMQPGMMQPGMMQPGMMQPGMMQPGMMQPGMMQPGMMPQQGMMQPGMMPQQGMMQPGMMQPGMMQPGMMQPNMMAGQIQIANGTRVHAMWQGDGQMHPGTVRGFQNGMYSVDWEEQRLGASTFVYPQQIQVQTGAPGFAHHDPHAKHVDPHAKQADPYGKQADPYGKQADAYGKQADAYGKQPDAHGKQADAYGKQPDMHGKQADPYGKQPDAHGKQADPHAKQFTPQIGSHITAQHPSGQWYPGRIVQMQNGMIGVDWDDAKLGQSTWVQPHQVR